MLLIDLFYVLVIVLVLTAIFSAGLARHRGSSLFAFFILLFALTWAAGIWIVPLGRPVLGGYWISFLVAGILFAILLMALIPTARPPARRGRDDDVRTSEYIFFGTFFWLLVVILTLIILAGYLIEPWPVPPYPVPVD